MTLSCSEKASDNAAHKFVDKLVRDYGVHIALVRAKALSQARPFAKHDPRWLRKAIQILTELDASQ